MSAGSENTRVPSLADKVAFLSQSGAYPGRAGPVTRRETHMSWIFFLDGEVYKLKKPVRFPYLNFASLARREAACRAELTLNQRLAPGIYEAVVPLVWDHGRLTVGGSGEVVDWLVVMRRFDQDRTLEARLLAGDLSDSELDALSDTLAHFYRGARRVHVPPAIYIARLRAGLNYQRRVLLDPRLNLPGGAIRTLLALQHRFLRVRSGLLARRARQGRILDAHGDLRPEHIWMGPPIKIIDRLEFSASLRAVDPLDELAFLDLEIERLAEPAAGARITRRVMAALHDTPAPELYLFYRSYRALLRARLSIAHLLEPDPRTPEKWPGLTRAYLGLAMRDARRLSALLKRPAGR